jgi:hypothetical protein
MEEILRKIVEETPGAKGAILMGFDITLKAEFGTVLVRVLSKEYFVTVLLETAAHMGKGRWLLRSQVKALNVDLTNT